MAKNYANIAKEVLRLVGTKMYPTLNTAPPACGFPSWTPAKWIRLD